MKLIDSLIPMASYFMSLTTSVTYYATYIFCVNIVMMQ